MSGSFRLTFVVDSQAGTAYVLGNAGTEPVSVVQAEDGMTFIEVTQTGNVMSTAVNHAGRSVHSRNTIMFGDLTPSQYYGTCKFK